MLRTRVLVGLALLPIPIAALYFGGWVSTLVVAAALGLASIEYGRMFRTECGDAMHQPTLALLALGSVTLILTRYLLAFAYADLAISLIILLVMVYFMALFEGGEGRAATGFAATVTGILYIGWMGAYLISLRELPEGMGWTLVVLSAVWGADTFAYLVGVRLGKHKLTRRLSPKKSWEGWLGGIVFATPIAAAFAYGWGQFYGPQSAMQPWHGAVLGLALAAFSVLGDLGESMIKRQFGVKDSSDLIPGHGGLFDRLDSTLWGAVIGYYVIVLFLLR
jgi:phosphatidate cytidylyltransferase